MATAKRKVTAEEAAAKEIAENGATLGEFMGLFAKLGTMPMEKPGTKKRGRKKKPGRKPKK